MTRSLLICICLVLFLFTACNVQEVDVATVPALRPLPTETALTANVQFATEVVVVSPTPLPTAASLPTYTVAPVPTTVAKELETAQSDNTATPTITATPLPPLYLSWDHEGFSGYVDSSGNWVIPPQYIIAHDFSDGLAFVMNEDRNSGYIDSQTGRMIIDEVYLYHEADKSYFSDGTALVFDIARGMGDAAKKVLIDQTGQILRLLDFPHFIDRPFAEGMAVVGKWGEGANEAFYGYIDRTGEIIIPVQFQGASSFSEGLAAVRVDGLWGYIDQTGQMIIEPQFSVALPFSEGLAPVSLDSLYGYIDMTGEFVIPPQYENAYPFSEALAPVQVNGLWGYIDQTGTMQIELQPNSRLIKPFKDGLARVQIEDNTYGYIDKKGEIAFMINPHPDQGFDFTLDDILAVYQGSNVAVSGQFIPALPSRDGGLSWATILNPAQMNFAFDIAVREQREHIDTLVYPAQPTLQIFSIEGLRRSFQRESSWIPQDFVAPFLSGNKSPTPAQLDFSAQVTHLNFNSQEEGLRYLGTFSVGRLSRNLDELYYLFQGVTEDQKYYIEFIAPIAAVDPDLVAIIQTDTTDMSEGEYEAHLQSFIQAVDEADPDDFSPNLQVLDDLITTLIIP